MWIKKITHRKTQFAIIMLLTMVATAIFTACVSFTLETQRYVGEYYSVENSPMSYMVLSRDDGSKLIAEKAESDALISKMVEGKVKYSTDTFYCNNKKMINDENFIYGVKSMSEIGYRVDVIEGEETDAPAAGEIWVCHVYADAHDIKVGDKIRIGNAEEFTVSAIVSSAICSSGFIDVYPFYVKETELDKIEGVSCYSLMVYAKDDTVTLKQLNDAIPVEIKAALMLGLEKSTLEMCLSILSGIFGGVGIVAAIIIFGVTVIVFRYLVRATIAKEYQSIGIYKALGMEDGEIKRIYLLAYLIAGGIGELPGAWLGRPIAVYLAGALIGSSKIFKLTEYTTYISIGTIVLIMLLLLVNIWGELSKVRSISPIQAMNMHTLSSAEKIGKSVIPNAHSAFSMAVNGLFKKRGITILTILILTTSVYMDLLAGAISLTLGHYADDREIWEHLPPYDGIIKMYESDKALDFVKESDMVESYVQLELNPICPQMSIEGTDKSYEEMHPMIYENFTEERYETVPFTAGRICTEPHEITASNAFLDEVNKKVGDYVNITVEEHSIDFLIVGSYSAMMKGGISFYLQECDAKELGIDNPYQTIMFYLKDGVAYQEFADALCTEVEDAHVYEDFAFIEEEGRVVGDIADPICAVLFGAFAMFSILNIINLLHTQNRENRRKYGILKAFGFTTGYIRRENLIAFTLEYAVAVVITLLLHMVLSPILFSLACGVRFIFSPMWLTVAVCGGMYLLLLLVQVIMSISIKTVKPVELMEE